MNPELFSWGLRVGQISGIVVRLHWFLLVFWILDLDQFLGWDVPSSHALGYWALYIAPSFLIILLHELGHCYAARRVGGHAEEVLLWPLGGLAFVQAPYHWRPQFLVAVGGPAVNVIILVLAFPGFALLSQWWPQLEASGIYRVLRSVLCMSNLYLLVFNLIPLYPLDGGRIFHSLVWGYQERKGGYGAGAHYQATMLTVYVSRVTAIITALVMLFGFQSFLGAFLAFWAWTGTEELRRRAQAGEVGDSGVFGYDFSRGYTSLEGSEVAPRKRTSRGLLARWRQRMADRNRISARDEQELEELLRKISAEGLSSLTRSERRFLEKMSRRKRG